MNKKVIILIIGVIIVVGIIIMFCLNNKVEVKKGNLDDIEITNVKLDVKDEFIFYEAKVKNVSGRNYKIKSIDVIMKDNKGKKIVTVTNEINKTLKKNEIIIMSSQTKANIKNKEIKRFTYKINKP